MQRKKKSDGRGSINYLLRDKHGWLPTLPFSLVTHVLDKEALEEDKYLLHRYVRTGKLPDDWDRDFQNTEWILCDYPVYRIACGQSDEGLASAAHNPLILGFNGEVWYGSDSYHSAILTGASSVLAYVPQRRGKRSEEVEQFRVHPTQKLAKGRFAQVAA